MGLSSEQQKKWIDTLNACGQGHLLSDAASDVERVSKMLCQIDQMDQNCPGGISDYVKRARHLLSQSAAGVNPFEGCTPEVPTGVKLFAGTTEFAEMENLGAERIARTCLVLVAGGLGERLGYDDIKISLPSETTTGTTFMHLYAKHIQAFQAYAAKELSRPVEMPLAIMTSDDTHDKTIDFFRKHSHFGLNFQQVHILKQEKVPSLIDNNAKFATCEDDRFSIETKPHGHGDVHTLLLQSSLAKQWHEQGYEWLVFFQDTNSLALRCLLPLVGVAAKNKLAMNSGCVPRKAKEAVGAICCLKKVDGSAVTCNVEYNQLEPMLKAMNGFGDVADKETGLSPFPGNLNFFVLHIPTYTEELYKCNGTIPEFVNPKYTDSSKTVFKSPTRLECMMQDIARVFDYTRVGFTEFERWISFSPVKNNNEYAAERAAQGVPAEAAFSGESDHYTACANFLKLAAEANKASPVSIAVPEPAKFAGIDYVMGPRIVLDPSFAISLEEMKKKLRKCEGKPFVIEKDSTLVIDGPVEISGLKLKGTLIVSAKNAEGKCLSDVDISNKGWLLKPIGPPPVDVFTMRGFKIEKIEEENL